jgi:probable DNA metabolism protein
VQKIKASLRFMENSEGVLYAPYSPENDITSLIAPHFAERFKRKKFVIHDTKRKIAAMYDGDNLVMFEAGGADEYLTQYEKAFDNLWQTYYKYASVSANKQHEKGYIPVRYFKFLPDNGDNA